ncbi:hypothetical protein E4T39_00164 [Aureobasidium subglaciale]|nr:hypothetical protein E4T39_00164 [Aureobasidium subglaciale]
MDIDQWIESLSQAHPPSESPLVIARPNATQKHRSSPRRSSLLEPFIEKKHHIDERRPVTPIGLSDPETSNATSTSAASFSSSTSSSSSSDRKYQRRPRHHTKADKYTSKSQPKPQTRKKEKRRKQERKLKRTKRHKHNSEAITGVVQSFHAKNVPNHRLTLGPSAKVGLYTKGRSSGPTRGKGCKVQLLLIGISY